MPLFIVRKNIAEMECDAIVNSTNNALRAEGYGVDGAISAAANNL